MTKELPSFAGEWVQQWKEAAPRLQAIRDEELRRRGVGREEVKGKRLVAGTRLFQRNPDRHGMVIMQRWWMRRHLLGQQVAGAKDQGDRIGPQ